MSNMLPALAAAMILLTDAACSGAPSEQSQPIVVEPPADEPTGGEGDGVLAGSGEEDLVVGEDGCATDTDCVPDACCHAAACVGAGHAPACGEAMCTQECRYGTLDCGGGCLCREGRCAARLSEPPPGLPRP